MVGIAASGGGALVDDHLKIVLAGRDTSFYKGHYLRLTGIVVLILITSMTNGYDGSMMNGLQTLKQWEAFFNNPSGGILGLFNAIQNIGGLLGLPFAPYVSDRYGRRTGIFLGSCIMVVGVILQTACQNFGMFIGARFLVGFGLSFASISAPVLLTELAFPTHRAPLTSLYNTSWYLGSIVAAWTTYGTFNINNNWSWRIPSLLQGIPSVLQILLIFTIPESPRFLVSRGKDDAALRVITKYHCNGDSEDPLIAYEYNEIRAALEMEREQKSVSWRSLLATPGNRRRMRVIVALGFFSQWSGNGLVSYYLTLVLKGIGITSVPTQDLINGILQIFNWFAAIFGALAVDKIGRRKLFLTSTAGMCVMFVFWTICSAIYARSDTTLDANGVPIGANSSAGHAVVAFIFLYYAFYDIALTPHIVSYTVEILPFDIRSKGLMVMQYCVSASLVFNQYANPIALDAIGWKYYIVYCVWIAFEFVFCYFTIIETKGSNGPLPLEEIARLFDGAEAVESLSRRVVEYKTGTEPIHVEDEKTPMEHDVPTLA